MCSREGNGCNFDEKSHTNVCIRNQVNTFFELYSKQLRLFYIFLQSLLRNSAFTLMFCMIKLAAVSIPKLCLLLSSIYSGSEVHLVPKSRVCLSKAILEVRPFGTRKKKPWQLFFLYEINFSRNANSCYCNLNAMSLCLNAHSHRNTKEPIAWCAHLEKHTHT